MKSGSETNAYIGEHSDHTYSIRPACGVGGTALCSEPATCNIEGHDGLLYNVYEDAEPDPLAWQACLTEQEAKRLGGLTPAMVQHAFQRLAWPSSELVVQPPKGRTLVNFDTNFYTTNTRPSTRTVTLIGQPVTVEATPTQYTWHFGTPEDDLSTTDPGAAYPDLRVTHRYTRVGAVTAQRRHDVRRPLPRQRRLADHPGHAHRPGCTRRPPGRQRDPAPPRLLRDRTRAVHQELSQARSPVVRHAAGCKTRAMPLDARRNAWPIAVVADAVAVLVFVVIGRANHHESTGSTACGTRPGRSSWEPHSVSRSRRTRGSGRPRSGPACGSGSGRS